MIQFGIATILLVFTILIGIPIAFSIGITTIVYILMTNPQNISIMPLRVFSGVDSFVLMAIPLFVLAAEIMVKSGISSKLFEFVSLSLGKFRGGLAYVNVVGSTIFGSISGAALSDIAGLGYIEMEAMKENGYDENFSAAVTAASSLQSPLIPPSNIIILYGGIMSISVGALLLAGIVPGLMLGLSQCIYIFLNAKKLNLPRSLKTFSKAERKLIITDGLICMIMPAIILVGILGGFFTATEAAAVAVLYALVVSAVIYKNLSLKTIVEAVWSSTKTTANLFLIIGFSTVFAWALGSEQIPDKIATFMLSISTNPNVLMFFISILLIIVGMWMDCGSAIILFAPILAPIMYKVGIQPIHFAMAMIVNLTIGLITPPVGVVLYATASVGKVKFENLVRALIPFIILGFVVVFMITFIPELSLFLPRLFKLI